MTEDENGSTTAEPRSPRSRRGVRLAPLSIVIGLVVVVLDIITKHWAVNALADGREVHVLWTLQWNLSYNTGMAFSRGRGMGPIIGVLAVVVVVILVIGASQIEGRAAKIAAGMLIGGAIGNVVDRLFRGDGWMRGAVIDFIDFQWFPIFNIADIGVTCGAILFMLASVLAGRHAAPTEIPATTS